MKRRKERIRESFRRFSSFFTKNLGLKVLSLSLSIIIYINLQPESNSSERNILRHFATPPAMQTAKPDAPTTPNTTNNAPEAHATPAATVQSAESKPKPTEKAESRSNAVTNGQNNATQPNKNTTT